MPKVEQAPKALRPYLHLGLELDWAGKEQAAGDCPFCGKEGKFSVNAESGLWKCWTCAEGSDRGGGNQYTFARRLWEASDEATGDCEELAAERRLLYGDTPMHWGACRSAITGGWLLPGYNAELNLVQLYQWSRDWKTGRNLLKGTWGLPAGLLMPHEFPGSQEVWVCEGPWDAMALWELDHSRCVFAVPGANTLSESWLPLFAGKHVHFLFDNDHPKKHEGNGKPGDGSGLAGTKRAARLLMAAKEPPASVLWLRWGKEGHDPSLSSGHDVRDWIAGGERLAGEVEELRRRSDRLALLLQRLEPVPAEWIKGASQSSARSTTDLLEPVPCDSWKKVLNAWRKALKMTDGLERAVAVMLATAASAMLVGDQLWTKIMSPPSTGKSVLAEALAVSRKNVKAVSTFRGFYSGYQEDREGKGKNYSLIEELHGKCLVIKDGDTLLTLPNKSEVLGQARDLYDTVGRSLYRNKMSRDWNNKRFPWVLFGTKSLRELDHSELGQRFLDCRIMDSVDEELEDEISWRKVNQVRNNRFEVDGRPETTDTAQMIEAKQLTAGYLDWLRSRMGDLYSGVDMSDEDARKCLAFGRFVAYMRARPSRTQDEEDAGREMSARLVSQITKMALCLAVVLNRKSTDPDVMAVVRQIAIDTAQGRTLHMVRLLIEAGDKGLTAEGLGVYEGETAAKERKLLHFLRRLGVVTSFKVKAQGLSPRTKWRLTPHFSLLCKKVELE